MYVLLIPTLVTTAWMSVLVVLRLIKL
ncbi:hypothetical protein P4S68_16225 [Pseudoalteromonas sp. Hal099]